MSKFIEYINSDTIDKNALFLLKFGTSLGTFALIFFFFVPTLIGAAKDILSIPRQVTSNVSGSIDIFLYYILNPIIAILVVRWQNRKFNKKPLKFKKIYCLAISLLLWLFVFVHILGHFIART